MSADKGVGWVRYPQCRSSRSFLGFWPQFPLLYYVCVGGWGSPAKVKGSAPWGVGSQLPFE